MRLLRQISRVIVIAVTVMLIAGCSRHSKANTKAIKALCTSGHYKIHMFDIVLNTNGVMHDPELFFIHNRSKMSLWLGKGGHSSGANAGWASQLSPNRWSAIVLSGNQAFTLTCSQLHKHRLKVMDCEQYIKVCDVAHGAYNTTLSGGYWATENKKASDFLPALQQRGVIVNHVSK